MTLPRFTSGQFGRLDFSHLNDAFGYIDEMRGTSPATAPTPKDSGVLFARIGDTGAGLGVQAGPNTALQFVGHYWNEVVSTGSGWEPFEGGRASGSLTTGIPVDAVQFPALSLTGKTLEQDVVAILFPQMTRPTDQFPARLFFAAVQISEGPQPMKVYGNEPIENAVGRWRYDLVRQRWNNSTKSYVDVDEGGVGTVDGYNTVETAIDNVPIESFGVGSTRGTGFTVFRRPIKDGTVVMATQLSSQTWHFSVPNGYSIGCG